MSSRSYLLALLAVLSAFNQLDRQLTAILLEPIRREFALSDVELGLLSGLAFALLYALLSFPAAVLAVRSNRRNLAAAAALVWGAMTAFSGLAQSFWQLLAGRIGIGAGEAGAMPASHAMISDLYGPHERATAMAVWSGGASIGIFLAFLAGGAVGQYFGWRIPFVICGLATMAAGLMLRFTATEPQRAEAGASLRRSPSLPLVNLTLARMWHDPVLRHVTIAATVTSIVSYGAVSFMPSFLVRAHQLSVAAVGLYLALVLGLGGGIIGILGGKLSDLLRRRDVRWSLWFVALAILVSKPFSLTFYLVGDTALALGAFVLPGVLGGIYVGPTLAVLHNRVPPTLRPSASALLLVFVNLIGLGLGPLCVGAMSEYLFSGPHALGYALAVLQILGLWGAVHFYLAGRALAKGEPRMADGE
jgi:predicted MFS family arabinose efflux permease